MSQIDFDALLRLLSFTPGEPMLFNSGLFLVLFLLFSAGYALLSAQRAKAVRLLYVTAFSYYFYYKNAGAWCCLLAVITLVNYFCALRLDHTERPAARKAWLWPVSYTHLRAHET